MSYIQFMFATPELEEILTQWKTFSQGTVERLILVGAIVLVSAWGLIWALFFRKSRRHRHRHHRRHHSSPDASKNSEADGDGSDSSEASKPRKRRRLRRPHRPHNPTLAETGGLPPARAGEPPEILP